MSITPQLTIRKRCKEPKCVDTQIMYRAILAHTCNWVVFNHKRNEILTHATAGWTLKHQGKLNKPDTKVYIMHDLIYMKILELTHHTDSHKMVWFFLLFCRIGAWTQGLHLQSKCSTTWATLSVPQNGFCQWMGQGRVARNCFIGTGFYVWMKGIHILLVYINFTRELHCDISTREYNEICSNLSFLFLFLGDKRQCFWMS
jgi:hypothetical protein